MGQFLIGWSEIDITPDKKVSLTGQFAERISEYVEKPITATAMAVSAGDDQMVLCGVDALGVSFALVESVRKNLKGNKEGLEPGKVVFAATHIHTGPNFSWSSRQTLYMTGEEAAGSVRSLLEPMLPPDKKYVESAAVTQNSEIATEEEVNALLIERLTKVVTDAWRNRKPGAYSNAFGRVAIGLCRRVVYSDGSAQMWGDTNSAVFTELEGGNDSGVELLYIFDDNEKLTGIVANVACPAQCVQHRHFISPDYWGETKVLLRKHFGEKLFLLPLCSPSGDQCPVDLIRWMEPESDVNDPNLTRKNPLNRKADPSMFDLSGMRKVGKRLAHEIIDVYEEGLDKAQTDGELIHHVRMLELPLRRATMAQYNGAVKAVEEYLEQKVGDVDYNDAAILQNYLGIIQRYRIQEVMEVLDTEAHFIRFGSVAIATNPFELFLDYGNQIRARSHAEQTFLVQLANGWEGYLPTEKAEKGGHYSAFIPSGQVGHIGGEQLVRQTLNEINQMFA